MPENACPSHGDLVRDLALGRLEDADALRAEQALAACGACSSWSRSLADQEVAQGVAAGLAAFRAPAAGSGAPRWAARIAAVLVASVGLGSAWLLYEQRPGPAATDPAAVADRVGGRPAALAPAGEVILAESLESGGPGAFRVHAAPGPAEVIFAEDLESGSFGSWRVGGPGAPRRSGSVDG